MTALTRILCLLLFIAIIHTACRKEELGSGRELIGVWVDIAHPSDTLIFTREAGQIVLFDNSLVYRSGAMTAGKKAAFRYYIRLGENRIATRPLVPLGSFDLDFREYPFYWLEEGKRFSVEPGSFRPYLSCVGCPQTFEKVQ